MSYVRLPGLRTILGGSRQRERFSASLGHVRRPREGPTFRIRKVIYSSTNVQPSLNFFARLKRSNSVCTDQTSCYYVSP